MMKEKTKISGFALLNVLLGVTLLTGIIFLVMHAMTNYHSEEKSRAIGNELAPIMDKLLLTDDLANMTNGNGYFLLSSSSSSFVNCLSTTALLQNVIPSGYIESLQTSGFNLCAAKVGICDVVNTSKWECK